MPDKSPLIESATNDPRDSYNEDEISFSDIILSLWRYRVVIVALSLVITFLIGSMAGLSYLLQNKIYSVNQKFKIEFKGIEKNEYPNGMTFSTADILTTSILDNVYKENKFEQFMTFNDFKASLSITQTNDRLGLIEYEYAAKLNAKLSLEQRQKVEDEFLELKKNCLMPIYTITFSHSNKLKNISIQLVAKVLTKILDKWAKMADKTRGANKYRVAIVSMEILNKEELEGEGYLVATDMLRSTTQRIKQDIKKLQEISGSETIKTKGGVSLRDLQYKIEDIERFKINPLIGFIRQSGASKNTGLTLGYLKNRLFELKLKKEQATDRIQVYKDSLSTYMQGKPMNIENAKEGELSGSLLQPELSRSTEVTTMIPQFGVSFLDSVINMAQKNSGAVFRQEMIEKVTEIGLNRTEVVSEIKFYEELDKNISNLDGSDSQSDLFLETISKRVEATHAQTYNALMQIIGDINFLYLQLSEQNLNPSSVLFSLPEPSISKVEKSIQLKKVALVSLLIWFISETMLFIGVFIFNSISNGIKTQKNTLA